MRQILVAGTEREPVFLANDGRDHHFHGNVQVLHHAFEHGNLLRVLLPENGDIRLREVKKNVDNGANAAKMRRAGTPAKPLRAGGFRDVGGKCRRIHRSRRRRKKNVRSVSAANLAVRIKRARIFFVVFVRSELRGIDENGNDEDVGARAGFVHERSVSGMKIAHGRDEGDSFSLRAERESRLLKFFGVVNDFHR